jgi:hypothetical protein
LSDKKLEKSISWLISHASAPVGYLTYLNILGEETDSAHVLESWRRVEEDTLSRYIFERQADDGSWYTGGPWHPPPGYLQKGGYTPVSPKYVTTVWILGILGDMGYSIEDSRVKKAVDYTLGWQLDNGVLTEDKREIGEDHSGEPPNYPCRMSIMLANLCNVRASSDPRLRKSLDLLVRWQREDGGWLSEGHRDGRYAKQGWFRGCPWVSSFSVRALYYSRLPEYRDALERGLRFLAWHLDQKPRQEIKRVFYHGHEPLRELEMFAKTGIALESTSAATLLEWLDSMYDPETGRYTYNGPSKVSSKVDKVSVPVMKFRGFHQTEDDWLTYRAVNILQSLPA